MTGLFLGQCQRNCTALEAHSQHMPQPTTIFWTFALTNSDLLGHNYVLTQQLLHKSSK